MGAGVGGAIMADVGTRVGEDAGAPVLMQPTPNTSQSVGVVELLKVGRKIRVLGAAVGVDWAVTLVASKPKQIRTPKALIFVVLAQGRMKKTRIHSHKGSLFDRSYYTSEQSQMRCVGDGF